MSCFCRFFVPRETFLFWPHCLTVKHPRWPVLFAASGSCRTYCQAWQPSTRLFVVILHTEAAHFLLSVKVASSATSRKQGSFVQSRLQPLSKSRFLWLTPFNVAHLLLFSLSLHCIARVLLFRNSFDLFLCFLVCPTMNPFPFFRVYASIHLQTQSGQSAFWLLLWFWAVRASFVKRSLFSLMLNTLIYTHLDQMSIPMFAKLRRPAHARYACLIIENFSPSEMQRFSALGVSLIYTFYTAFYRF